jgi:hypothetical protein
MISILAYWLLILTICYSIGFGFSKFINAGTSFSLSIILGIISITFMANVLIFLAPINWIYFSGLIGSSILLIMKYKKEMLIHLANYIDIIKNKGNLLLISLSSIVFAIYSSGFSNINDDGLYYSQAIMWLNQYGLVHGLSNLHLSLGLCSSWHVFQAIFTFPNTTNFNDVNGLLMLVFTLFILEQNQKDKMAFWAYLQYILILLISIPFLSAPNPDFSIIIFSAITIQLFITKKNYSFILLLAAFCFSIKISAIITSLIAIYIVISFPNTIKSWRLIIFTALIVIIHISKNIYQTAYPLYPYKIAALNLTYKTPEPIINFFTDGVKAWAFSDKYKPKDVEQLRQIKQLDIIKNLLFRTGSKGLINKIILIAFLLSNLLIAYLHLKKRLEKKFLIMHIINCIGLVIWFIIAPQYRFALPMLVYFLSFIFYLFYQEIISLKLKINLYYLNLLILIGFFIVSFTGINIKANETSTQIGTFNKLTAKQLLIPQPAYTFKMDTILVNNQFYYHAQGNRYCWNSPLPCMSKGYEKIIFENYHYRISLRGKSLKEGFKFIYYD